LRRIDGRGGTGSGRFRKSGETEELERMILEGGKDWLNI